MTQTQTQQQDQQRTGRPNSRRDAQRQGSARSRARSAATLAAVALLSSGCLFATEMDVSVSRDGSGSAVIVLQYDDDIARIIGPAAQFEREVLDAQAEGADVSIIPASDLEAPFAHGLRYEASFEDADGLRDVLVDGPFDTANVRLDEGVLDIDARFDGTGGDDDDLFGIDALPGITARVTIEVDGDVTSSNATSSSSSTHTWRFDLAEDGRLQMTAELASGPSATFIIGILVALLAAVGAVGAVLAFRRREAQDPRGADGADGTDPLQS